MSLSADNNTRKRMKINIWKTENRYGVIEADPPWQLVKGGKKAVRPNSSGKPLDYATMSYADIYNVLRQAYDLLEDNGVLFLWAIEKNLNQVEIMANAIGFKLHARMIWDKTPYGIPAAFTIRYGHEYLLYLYKGKLLPIAKKERGKVHSVFRESPLRGGHSTKPIISKQIMERLYPNQKKLELFARRARDGWDCWGDEAQEDKCIK